jgi:tRNA:m4X modification enzyme
VCNAKAPTNLPDHIKTGCNVGDAPDDDETTFRLQDVPQSELDEVIKKIEKLFEKFVAGTIETRIETHKILDEELAKEEYGSLKRKHLLQASSILGIMQQEDFLTPKTCFIEFGAGKAALTFWLANSIKDLEKAKVLVIDRASHRHKKDNLIRDRDLVERIRADIADLDLKGLKVEQDCFVGISKHLCGAATDLTLRCIVQGNESEVKTRGILIATCCHHRCTFNTFVGKDWLKANEIDRKTFNLMIKIVSWCTCGDGHNRHNKNDSEDKEIERKEKEEIGWKCKRLLDFARLDYMNQNNFDMKMNFYAEKKVTLENVCLIGKLRKV